MTVMTMSTMKDRVGSELGVSDWMVVGQERINEFAECTGDRQWIHVDIQVNGGRSDGKSSRRESGRLRHDRG